MSSFLTMLRIFLLLVSNEIRVSCVWNVSGAAMLCSRDKRNAEFTPESTESIVGIRTYVPVCTWEQGKNKRKHEKTRTMTRVLFNCLLRPSVAN